jgi:glycosyltransferase involved in cell wall biosynthesis
MQRRNVRVWLPAIHGGSGVDVHTRRLASALERFGVGATISWFSTYFQFVPFALSRVSAPPGTTIVHALSWSGYAFHRSELPLVISEQLDVLDPTYRPYKSVAQALYHETLIRHFMKNSFAAASAVTAVSRATAASLKQSVNLESVEIIPNFIDTEIFRPQSSVRRGAKNFILLFIGNLTKRKGADLLAPIMKQLGNGFELRFTTGLRDGNLSEITPNMASIGRLTSDQELVAAYHDCDALLFPSRLEGLAIAPLEAMACGKPIIATRISSLPEVVDDGVTGVLCAPDNVADFVAACRTLADSPAKRTAMAVAARGRAEKLFAETAVVPRYIALYERLVSRRDR